MPNRILKESICTSDTIDSLTWFEEVFWYRLIVNCDDYGRFDGRPAIIKSRLFPLKNAVTEKTIVETLNKLSTVGLVVLYTYEDRPYLQLVTWEKHQQVRAHKSKYPAFDASCNQMIADDIKCPRNPIQSESNPNPNTNTKAAPTKKQKHKYGEYQNVLLSDEDVKKLKEKFPTDWQSRVEQLSQGIELKGYTYKNHYLAILKWAEREYPKAKSAQQRDTSYDIDAYEHESIFDDLEG